MICDRPRHSVKHGKSNFKKRWIKTESYTHQSARENMLDVGEMILHADVTSDKQIEDPYPDPPLSCAPLAACGWKEHGDALVFDQHTQISALRASIDNNTRLGIEYEFVLTISTSSRTSQVTKVPCKRSGRLQPTQTKDSPAILPTTANEYGSLCVYFRCVLQIYLQLFKTCQKWQIWMWLHFATFKCNKMLF